jgi:hypothetical protein
MKKLIALLLGMCFLSANATSWRLNNNPAVDADFRTFAEAHDAAASGDTIYVEGTGLTSDYGYLVNISKKLIVIGPGYFLEQNDSTYVSKIPAVFRSIVIEAGAAGSELHGLHLEYGQYGDGGINIKASDIVITRSYFAKSNDPITIGAHIQNITVNQNYAYRIITSYETSVKNILISNNYFEDRITLNNLSTSVISNNVIRSGLVNVYNSQIKNNIVFAAGAIFDALCAGNAGNNISYNLSSGGLAGGTYGPGNIGNVDMSTVFVGYPTLGTYSTDGRWKLKTDGPAAGGGEAEIDCGMFGGPLAYVLSGLPAIPRIYEAVVPVAGSTVSGLPVIIKAKAQK